MSIQPDEVLKVAHLARLGVNENEVVSYASDLSDILQMVEQLNDANTASTTPMEHPLDLVQRLRTDQVTEVNQRETLQQNAPSTEEGLFLVPRVID